jgi:hypothetical protein
MSACGPSLSPTTKTFHSPRCHWRLFRYGLAAGVPFYSGVTRYTTGSFLRLKCIAAMTRKALSELSSHRCRSSGHKRPAAARRSRSSARPKLGRSFCRPVSGSAQGHVPCNSRRFRFIKAPSLSESSPSIANGRSAAAFSSPPITGIWLRSRMVTRSVQPLAMSVNVRVWIKSPSLFGSPQRSRMSISKKPGGGSRQSENLRTGMPRRIASPTPLRRLRCP